MATLPVYVATGERKPKLSREFSWLIGVEALSQRFSHVPQYNNLSVWFSDRPMQYDFRIDQIVRQQLPYQVFTVWYSTIGDPHWFFMVYPVDRTKRKDIREMLELETFPTVDVWMCEKKTETWLDRPHHLRCIYDPPTCHIAVRED